MSWQGFPPPFEDMLYSDDFPERPDQPTGPAKPISEWGMLARGQTLGKRAILRAIGGGFGPPSGEQTSPVDIFTISAPDEYALNLSVTLSTPQWFPDGSPIPDNVQNASGSYDNITGLAGVAAADTPLLSPATALLEWGIGGTSNFVEVDYINGSVVNLTASWVRLKAMILDPGSTSLWLFAANIGPGKPKDINAQKTIGVGPLLGANSSGVRVIPRFAKRVYLSGSVVSPNIFVGLLQIHKDSNLLNPISTLLFNSNEHNPAPIPNGAYYFTAQNQSGVDAINVKAVFELGI